MKLGLIGECRRLQAWLGGLVYSPVWSVLFLALGVRRDRSVALQITRQIGRGDERARAFTSTPVLGGLLAGFAVM